MGVCSRNLFVRNAPTPTVIPTFLFFGKAILAPHMFAQGPLLSLSPCLPGPSSASGPARRASQRPAHVLALARGRPRSHRAMSPRPSNRAALRALMASLSSHAGVRACRRGSIAPWTPAASPVAVSRVRARSFRPMRHGPLAGRLTTARDPPAIRVRAPSFCPLRHGPLAASPVAVSRVRARSFRPPRHGPLASRLTTARDPPAIRVRAWACLADRACRAVEQRAVKLHGRCRAPGVMRPYAPRVMAQNRKPPSSPAPFSEHHRARYRWLYCIEYVSP